MINARIESVAEKPSFRKAVAMRRCVVPMSSFFEWHTDEQGNKDPFRIYSKSVQFLAGAGIWEEWHRHSSASEKVPERLVTFSLLTCDANEFMSKIHHRMPVLLDERQQSSWLNPAIQSGGKVLEAVAPVRGAHIDWASDRVSKLVNSPKNDRPEIWSPAQ
jgi:putative SOS response-associated peptidase YedK